MPKVVIEMTVEQHREFRGMCGLNGKTASEMVLEKLFPKKVVKVQALEIKPPVETFDPIEGEIPEAALMKVVEARKSTQILVDKEKGLSDEDKEVGSKPAGKQKERMQCAATPMCMEDAVFTKIKNGVTGFYCSNHI